MRHCVIGGLLAFAFNPAFAETILTCTYDEGRSYYPALKGRESKEAGWKTDDMKGAQVRLDKTENGYDILFSGGKSTLNSSIEKGATVADLSHEEDSATFLVLYPNRAIETYYFYETTKETPELLLSQLRFNDEVEASAIYRYTCKRKRDEDLERRSQ